MRAIARTCNSFCSDNRGLDKVGIETVHEESQAGGDLIGADGLRQLNGLKKRKKRDG